MQQRLGLAQIEFVPADAFMIVQDHLHVFVSHGLRHVQVEILQDEVLLFWRQWGPGSLLLGPERSKVLWVDLVQLTA